MACKTNKEVFGAGVVKVGTDGKVSLPKRIVLKEALAQGDKLVVTYVNSQIILQKLDPARVEHAITSLQTV